METRLTKPPETHSSSFNSRNSPNTLYGSPSNSPEKTLYSSDFDDDLSPLSEATLPDNDPSDFDSLLGETDSKDGENEGYELNDSSPVYISSHWASQWNTLHSRPTLTPWSLGGMEDSKASEDSSSFIDWASVADSEIKPTFSPSVTEYRPSHMGSGLANLGNTCFLNAVLQCFTYTVPLLQGLLARIQKVTCESCTKGFCLYQNLFEHIICSLINKDGIVYPWKFVNNLNYFSSSFRRFQQEDAHEFLQCFLDKLESCCSDFKCAESDNIVKQVFGGRLVSKLQCCNCGHCSDTYEPSIDLSLEIDEVGSLSSALESFTKVEKIEDPDMKFTCENCKEQVSVEKQLMLDEAPSVATFHLKRFKNDGSFVEKIDKYVAFPLELDLLTYTAGNQSDKAEMMYDLYAVVVHTGFSSTSGHYYCFIRVAPNEWYRFDDSEVLRVEQRYVLMQEAYILFYVKQGTPWFSSFIEAHKPCMDLSRFNTSPKSVLDMMDVCSSPSLTLKCRSYVNEASDTETVIGLRDCEETFTGTSDCRVDGSDKKENLVSPLPLVASSFSDVASCETNNSAAVSAVNNSSDVPLCKADKSNSVPVIDGSTDAPSCEAGKSISLPVLKENNSVQECGDLGSIAAVVPIMPPRSPSPEIYKEETPGTTSSIPRGHLRLMNQVSCKRQLTKDLEDLERKQACNLIKKNMPGSRGKQLMAAMCGSLSNGSRNKKRSRGMLTSPSRDDRNSVSRRRGRIPVLASSLR